MNTDALSFFFGQLGAQTPALLVYLAGVIAAIVFLRRARMPSLACLLGCGLMIITTLAVTAIQAWMLQLHLDGSWPASRYGQAMSMIGIVSGAIRAVGLALVVAAVFLGREPARNPAP